MNYHSKSTIIVFVALLTALVALPVSAEDYSKPYSHFQFELTPGQGVDDAVVVNNPDSVSHIVELNVSDVVLASSEDELVAIDAATESDASSIRHWIRFYPSQRPLGSEEMEVIFGSSYPSSVFPLCSTLRFGSMGKEEREQLAVKNMGRSLNPSEIRWLNDISAWCVGEASPQIEIPANGYSRVSFVLLIPEHVKPSYYQSVIIQSSKDGSDIAATVSIVMPGVQPASIVVSDPVITFNALKRGYDIHLNVSNRGGLSAVIKPELDIEYIMLVHKRSIVKLNEFGLGGGQSKELSWFIPRPLFGELHTTPRVSFLEVGSTRSKVVDSIVPVEVFVFPTLSFLLIIGVIIVSIILFLLVRIYWIHRWIASVRQSWVSFSPNHQVSLRSLASEFGVSVSLLSKVNNLEDSDMVSPSDTILAPSIANLRTLSSQQSGSQKQKRRKPV